MKIIYNYLMICICAAIFLTPNFTKAQPELPCANEVFQNLLFKDSSFITSFNDVNKAIESQKNQRISAGTIQEIPLAIHIFNLGEPVGTGTNISDQQIIDAVRGANERWRKITTVGVDMEVQFCIAQYDVNGIPSNGIIRKNASSIPNYSQYGIGYIGSFGQPGADETTLKNFSNWDHNFVLNIWVVKDIAGDFGGYAYIPFNFNYPIDGVVITYNAMRYNSSTLTHELGHAMGLFHTFQGSENGCAANDFCFLQGDWVCDTPPHKQTECTNTGSNCLQNATDSIYKLSFANVMSYCGGRNLFTQGQKTRVKDVINSSTRSQLTRSFACTGKPCDTVRTQLNAQTCDSNAAGISIDSLQTSKGCDSIVRTITTFKPLPNAAFTYVVQNDSIKFNNQSQLANTYYWIFGDDSTSTETSPTHFYASNGNYQTSLIASNNCGSDTLTQTIISPIISGIKNNSKTSTISVYPNPTNGIFNINIDIKENNTYLEVVNVLGQNVATQSLATGKQHTIILENNLAKGIYLLVIKTNNSIIANTLLSIY